MIQVFIFDYKRILKRRMSENLEFLKSKLSYLTIDKYRKDGCLKIYRRISKTRMFENLRFFFIQAFVFDYRQILKRRMFVLKSRIFETQVFVFYCR